MLNINKPVVKMAYLNKNTRINWSYSVTYGRITVFCANVERVAKVLAHLGGLNPTREMNLLLSMADSYKTKRLDASLDLVNRAIEGRGKCTICSSQLFDL